MQQKIYITIDLPDEIKESLRKEESRWKNLRVFWEGFSHVRLTLEYLGVTDREDLRRIKKSLQMAADEFGAFDICLERIVLGPDAREPKMLWVTVFEDQKLKRFRARLRELFQENGFELKEDNFLPHIVMATAKGNQLKGKKTSVKLRGKFRAEGLNLLSSQTYAGGITKYKLVDNFPLQK